MITRDEIIDIFQQYNVIQQGHFLLSSGLHSGNYVQCAKIFEYPNVASQLVAVLVEKLSGIPADIVIGPAVGAITMAYEVSRQMGVPNLFAEREHGQFRLRRGFEIPEGSKVLLVEDVVTTGGSVRELFPLVAEAGAEVIAVGCMLDRSGGRADFGVPLKSVLEMQVETFDPEDCPMCAAGQPVTEPGSRRLR